MGPARSLACGAVPAGQPLSGRGALVTGVGRRAGIGFAIAQRLLGDGARVVVHSWGDDPAPVLAALGGAGDRLAHVEADLGEPGAPAALVDAAVAALGHLDVLVANHAHSSDQTLGEVTAEELDRAWAVNARASVLLTQAFAAAHDDARPGGRVVLFTSGQAEGPMAREIAYAVSKGAIHQMTPTLADALADRAITVNAVNPGPVDTGWAGPERKARLAAAFPARRLGTPADVAPVVAWLAGDESRWVTGQVINAEGGFRRPAI
jgi:3-oxoacyl-[acyl-carrier protein] reductase